MDHRGEPGHGQIGLGGPGGQHADVLWGHAPALEGGPDRLGRHLLVEDGGSPGSVDGVVTLLDAVGLEHPLS